MQIRHIRFISTNRAGDPGSQGGSLRTGPGAAIGRALAVLAGGMIVMAALFVSAVVFSALLVAGVAAGGWFWWKTREVRRQLRERMAQPHGPAASRTSGKAADAGVILDGDFIRETHPPGSRAHSVPARSGAVGTVDTFTTGPVPARRRRRCRPRSRRVTGR